MTLTLEEFKVIVKLLGGDFKSGACSAARMVLVEGKPQAEACAFTASAKQPVADTVRRYQNAHKLILKAYQRQT